MYKKTFFENISRFFEKIIVRVSINAILFAVCTYLLTNDVLEEPFASINGLCFIYSIYNFLAVFPLRKSYFIKEVNVVLQSGEEISCAIIRQKMVSCSPVPLIEYLSLARYIPYQVKYYIFKNVSIAQLGENEYVCNEITEVPLLLYNEINKRKAKAIMENPQIIADELSLEITKARQDFCDDIKKFVETGFFEELYYTSGFSVCKVFDFYLLFNYNKFEGSQTFVFIDEATFVLLKEEKDKLFASYFVDDGEPFEVHVLDDTVYNNMIKLAEERK